MQGGNSAQSWNRRLQIPCGPGCSSQSCKYQEGQAAEAARSLSGAQQFPGTTGLLPPPRGEHAASSSEMYPEHISGNQELTADAQRWLCAVLLMQSLTALVLPKLADAHCWQRGKMSTSGQLFQTSRTRTAMRNICGISGSTCFDSNYLERLWQFA